MYSQEAIFCEEGNVDHAITIEVLQLDKRHLGVSGNDLILGGS